MSRCGAATVLTLFPDLFPGPLGASLAGKALAAKLWALEAVDIRASATDRYRTVDDTPAGGGPGMVMKPDVLARAIDAGAAARPAAPADEPARQAAEPGAGCVRWPVGRARSSCAAGSKGSTSG